MRKSGRAWHRGVTSEVSIGADVGKHPREESGAEWTQQKCLSSLHRPAHPESSLTSTTECEVYASAWTVQENVCAILLPWLLAP